MCCGFLLVRTRPILNFAFWHVLLVYLAPIQPHNMLAAQGSIGISLLFSMICSSLLFSFISIVRPDHYLPVFVQLAPIGGAFSFVFVQPFVISCFFSSVQVRQAKLLALWETTGLFMRFFAFNFFFSLKCAVHPDQPHKLHVSSARTGK